MDIALGGSSEQIRDLHENDQQDETRPMVSKISQTMDFIFVSFLMILIIVGHLCAKTKKWREQKKTPAATPS